jgi:hypothetical protein
MKRILILLALLGFAVAAPSGTTLKSGVFFATAGSDAKVRFVFKLEPTLLFNRAGSSYLLLETPWSKKPIEVIVEKGTPDKDLPDEYHSTLEPVLVPVRVPVGTKAGKYPIKLSSEFFLCDNTIKVCYIDKATGTFEIQVGTGKDLPVQVEFSRNSK